MIPFTTVEYWHSWWGFSCLLLMFFSSLYNLIAPNVHDGFFDRLYRWVIIFTSGAGIYSVIADRVPYHVAITLLTATAIKMAVSTLERIANRHTAHKPPEEC